MGPQGHENINWRLRFLNDRIWGYGKDIKGFFVVTGTPIYKKKEITFVRTHISNISTNQNKTFYTGSIGKDIVVSKNKKKKVIDGTFRIQISQFGGTFQIGTFDMETPKLPKFLLNPLGKVLQPLEEIPEKPSNLPNQKNIPPSNWQNSQTYQQQ